MFDKKIVNFQTYEGTWSQTKTGALLEVTKDGCKKRLANTFLEYSPKTLDIANLGVFHYYYLWFNAHLWKMTIVTVVITGAVHPLSNFKGFRCTHCKFFNEFTKKYQPGELIPKISIKNIFSCFKNFYVFDNSNSNLNRFAISLIIDSMERQVLVFYAMGILFLCCANWALIKGIDIMLLAVPRLALWCTVSFSARAWIWYSVAAKGLRRKKLSKILHFLTRNNKVTRHSFWNWLFFERSKTIFGKSATSQHLPIFQIVGGSTSRY